MSDAPICQTPRQVALPTLLEYDAILDQEIISTITSVIILNENSDRIYCRYVKYLKQNESYLSDKSKTFTANKFSKHSQISTAFDFNRGVIKFD